ncbi:calcium/sodium antiporter [Candidatus Leptofilum sp.]|uniref:calcium/sodium antiporter n=1 Tax=Candidatus Leptofilum sp. TaxID=3241576 RepID=UPI003B59DC3A
MKTVLDIVIIIACIVALWQGAELVVNSATRIARKIGMSDLVIGLTVVAIGTSAPEFAVTVVAALEGQSDISVGNVVGSNIFNLGFILGGLALLKGIATTKTMVYRDGGMLIGTTILLIIFLYDLSLSRFESAALLIILVTYVGFLIYRRAESEEHIPEGDFNWLDVPKFIVGIAIIVAAGHYFVEAASDLARLIGLSEWVIGVTVVAIGTSAPEIATSLVALLRGQSCMSAGNLIGSDLFNLLGVLGLAGLLHPMVVAPAAQSSILLLGGMVVLVVIMMRTGWRLSRWEGGILILITLGRWILDFTR